MKNLNLINKILTIILVSIIVLVTGNDMVFLILASTGIIYCLYSRKFVLMFIFILSVVLEVVAVNFDFLRIYKIYDVILILGLIMLIIGNFSLDQRRYLFDRFMYRFKNSKKTKKHLRKCYYAECLSKNLEEVSKYNNLTNSKFLHKQAVLKTTKDLNDIYLLYKLRFYQIYNKKSPLFPDRWTRNDTFYLIVVITIFCMLLCVR